VVWIAQVFPFQLSAKGEVPLEAAVAYPTELHAAAAVHETPVSTPL
jgi:hypothetical protein